MWTSVSGWIGLLPGPAIAAHLLEGSAGTPAEHGLGLLGAGFQSGHITGPALHNLIGNGEPSGGFKPLHHLQHAQTAPSSDVQREGVWRRLLKQVLEGPAVGFGQVHHVQLIADAGAIRCGVVLAEDAQTLAAACGHLGDEREQVVGIPSGSSPMRPLG